MVHQSPYQPRIATPVFGVSLPPISDLMVIICFLLLRSGLLKVCTIQKAGSVDYESNEPLGLYS